MNKKIIWFALFGLLLFACRLTAPQSAETATQPQAPAGGQTYPLDVGAYWDYQGWVVTEQGEEDVRWRVEVLEKVERLNVTGYRMRGALYDLAFYSPEQAPGEYAILQTGGRFYTTDLETYARLKDEGDFLIGLIGEGSLLLDLPLQDGGRFCEPAELTRDDGMYCWVVSGAGKLDLPVLPAQSPPGYIIEYRTNPDFSSFTFVPGVGFAAFFYRHFGSASEVDVRLVEYSLGGDS